MSQHEIVDYRNAKYQGLLNEKNLRESIGVLIDDDLSFYISNWQNNNLHGNTLIYMTHGKYIYGEWRHNQPHGLNIFRTGDTVFISIFHKGKIQGRSLIIFEKLNFITILEDVQTSQSSEYKIIESGHLLNHQSLLNYIKHLGYNIPDHYFSLTKYACSMSNAAHSIVRTFPCGANYCYFGFVNGLAIVFNSNNGVVSIGHHLNEEIIQCGGKFTTGKNKTIQEGIFTSSHPEIITYFNTEQRPVHKIYSIYQKSHKRSLTFQNQYFDPKIKILTDLEHLLRGKIKNIVDESRRKQYELSAMDLNDSLDYQQYDEEETNKINKNREDMYEHKNSKSYVNGNSKMSTPQREEKHKDHITTSPKYFKKYHKQVGQDYHKNSQILKKSQKQPRQSDINSNIKQNLNERQVEMMQEQVENIQFGERSPQNVSASKQILERKQSSGNLIHNSSLYEKTPSKVDLARSFSRLDEAKNKNSAIKGHPTPTSNKLTITNNNAKYKLTFNQEEDSQNESEGKVKILAFEEENINHLSSNTKKPNQPSNHSIYAQSKVIHCKINKSLTNSISASKLSLENVDKMHSDQKQQRIRDQNANNNQNNNQNQNRNQRNPPNKHNNVYKFQKSNQEDDVTEHEKHTPSINSHTNNYTNNHTNSAYILKNQKNIHYLPAGQNSNKLQHLLEEEIDSFRVPTFKCLIQEMESQRNHQKQNGPQLNQNQQKFNKYEEALQRMQKQTNQKQLLVTTDHQNSRNKSLMTPSRANKVQTQKAQITKPTYQDIEERRKRILKEFQQISTEDHSNSTKKQVNRHDNSSQKHIKHSSNNKNINDQEYMQQYESPYNGVAFSTNTEPQQSSFGGHLPLTINSNNQNLSSQNHSQINKEKQKQKYYQEIAYGNANFDKKERLQQPCGKRQRLQQPCGKRQRLQQPCGKRQRLQQQCEKRESLNQIESKENSNAMRGKMKEKMQVASQMPKQNKIISYTPERASKGEVELTPTRKKRNYQYIYE